MNAKILVSVCLVFCFVFASVSPALAARPEPNPDWQPANRGNQKPNGPHMHGWEKEPDETPPTPTEAGADAEKTEFSFGGSISGLTWLDVNKDGIQQPNEPRWPEVEVHLYDVDSSIVAVTKTDLMGKYSFTNVAPGNYKVWFSTPEGFIYTLQFEGEDKTIDSDANEKGMTPEIVIHDNESFEFIDCGFIAEQ